MTYCQRGLLGGFLAIQAFLAGCTHGQAETVGNGQTQEWAMPQPPGPPVALYAIPPIEPKGKVCVRSLGHEQAVGPGRRLGSFLHISMAVENAADTVTWTLDPRDMKLNFVGSSRPVSAYSKAVPKGATLAIPQGKIGELDLYFPSTERSRPLHVNFLWKLHRGSETDTVSTRFENAGPIPTVSEDVGGPSACGQLSRVADRHATVRQTLYAFGSWLPATATGVPRSWLCDRAWMPSPATEAIRHVWHLVTRHPECDQAWICPKADGPSLGRSADASQDRRAAEGESRDDLSHGADCHIAAPAFGPNLSAPLNYFLAPEMQLPGSI